MEIAEVIKRKQGLLLRIGFGEDGELLEPVGPVELGSIVEVDRDGLPEGSARVRIDDAGQPVIVAGAATALAGVYRIALHNGIRVGFGTDVAAEVAAIVADPGIDDPALEDWTHLPLVTIDYARSKDLDQALYVTRDGDGYRVYYALADAAHYIRPGSALFAGAADSGSSFYLPGLTAPMLPVALSEGIVSLNEGEDRRALVFDMKVGADGTLLDTELVRARVRSRRKLTYAGVQAYVDDPAGSPLRGQEFTESLELLGEVGRLRIAEADAREVVRYDRIAVSLGLADRHAARLSVTAEPRNDVQSWNEQISLMTNIAGAEFLTSRVDRSTGFAGVFRVHPPPEAEDLEQLAESIRDLVTTLGLDDAWVWRRAAPNRESLGDYVDRLPDDGDGVRLACALQRQAMLINRPSYFATEPGPHYGIGASSYARFSSPMREIVGVVTDFMALHQLAGTPVSESGFDREIIERAVEAGNRAKKLQKRVTRQANKLAIDQLFMHELKLDLADRPIRTATVLGVSATKIYLQLDEPPIEVKLYVPDQETLLDRSIEVDTRFSLSVGEASVRVGDPARVCVHHYDDERERWILGLVLEQD